MFGVMRTEILYNGQCPICAAEIAHYRKLAMEVAAPLDFVDLHSAPLNDWGLTPEQATRRIHARQDGVIISGFPAFVLIWRAVPKLHWMARVANLPVVRHIAAWGYNWIAAPALYRLHLYRMRRV